jgi:hypothetical protein
MLISSRGDSMSFGHLSLLAVEVASPFERERIETDVMLIPEADNQPTRRYGRCHHGTQPSLNIQ